MVAELHIRVRAVAVFAIIQILERRHGFQALANAAQCQADVDC
jgi:hypothetical protein